MNGVYFWGEKKGSVECRVERVERVVKEREGKKPRRGVGVSYYINL